MIRWHIASRGFAPSQEELCGALGWSGLRSAQLCIKRLEALGEIEVARGVARGIRLKAKKEKAASYTIEKNPPCGAVNGGILTAFRLARRYTHRVPAVSELMEDYGMSRATAYRWIAAMRMA